jgi:hypothetical protein
VIGFLCAAQGAASERRNSQEPRRRAKNSDPTKEDTADVWRHRHAHDAPEANLTSNDSLGVRFTRYNTGHYALFPFFVYDLPMLYLFQGPPKPLIGSFECYVEPTAKRHPTYLLGQLYSSSSLTRRASSSISQLRTGPSFLNADRFKSDFISSPACDAYGSPHEIRAYFLLECPAWEHLRQPLHDAAKTTGLFGSLHLSPILTHP